MPARPWKNSGAGAPQWNPRPRIPRRPCDRTRAATALVMVRPRSIHILHPRPEPDGERDVGPPQVSATQMIELGLGRRECLAHGRIDLIGDVRVGHLHRCRRTGKRNPGSAVTPGRHHHAAAVSANRWPGAVVVGKDPPLEAPRVADGVEHAGGPARGRPTGTARGQSRRRRERSPGVAASLRPTARRRNRDRSGSAWPGGGTRIGRPSRSDGRQD